MLFLTILVIVGIDVTGNLQFIFNDFWFAAGFLLLLLMSFIDQPFFSTDANVFMNGTAGLSLILVEPGTRGFWWWFFLFWCSWLIISSYILMWFKTKKTFLFNPLVTFTSKLNHEIGRPEAIFSAFFIWGILNQFSIGNNKIAPLFIFWSVFMIINIPGVSKVIDQLINNLLKRPVNINNFADFYKVSDPRIIDLLVKEGAPHKLVGRQVEFLKGTGESIGEAIIIDDRIITGNRVIKAVNTTELVKWNFVAEHPDGIVISLKTRKTVVTEIPISVIDKGSTIGLTKFYINPDIALRKGEIVWTSDDSDMKIYYQVTSAIIIEDQSIDGNCIKSVLVSASQLGVWNKEELSFEPYPWVAPVGKLIYREPHTSSVSYQIPSGRIRLGNIPCSSFPIHASINDLVTHNTALIGVTGSGKSYLGFHLIEGYINQGIKVFIFDLTREHYKYLEHLKPVIVNTENEIDSWIKSENQLGLHLFSSNGNYPEITNRFVQSIFKIISQTPLNPGEKIPAKFCIVFEEAHSIIPEWNQVANRDDSNFVNSTARTILQGRKFGMGCLIITQRTANVTKTILNQCNSIVALRSFDQTGLEFLTNYMGAEYSQAISTLPARDAILVGKSSSCLSPVIFSILDLSSKWPLGEKTKG